MNPSFWIFLTVVIFMGMLLPMIAIITKHTSSMKQLELEASKIKQANLHIEDEDAAQRKSLWPAEPGKVFLAI